MCTIQGSGPISLKLVLSPVKQHNKHCDTTPDNVLGRVTLKTPASPYVDRAFFMLLKCSYKSPLPPPVFVHTSGQSPTSPSIYTLPHLRMGGGGQPDFYYIINYQFEAHLSQLDIKWDSLASCETIIYQMMLMGPLPPSLFCFWEPEEKGMKDCVCLCVCGVEGVNPLAVMAEGLHTLSYIWKGRESVIVTRQQVPFHHLSSANNLLSPLLSPLYLIIVYGRPTPRWNLIYNTRELLQKQKSIFYLAKS